MEPWSPEAGNSRDSLGAHTALGGYHAVSYAKLLLSRAIPYVIQACATGLPLRAS